MRLEPEPKKAEALPREGVLRFARGYDQVYFNSSWIRRSWYQWPAAAAPSGRSRSPAARGPVVDRGAKAFVQDLDAEQFGRGGSPVLVGGGDGDVEGQALVAVPGKSGFLEALDGRQRNVVEVFRGGVHGKGNVAGDRRAEGSGLVGGQAVGDLELGTDLSWGAPLALT